jgi:hypothetical protein
MTAEDDITSEEMLAVSAEVGATYPPPRAGTELVLLDVNPHRAHAFWNIDLEDYRAAEQRAGGMPLVIRLHDVTGIDFDGKNPHDTHDAVVSGMQGQTDLNVRRDGRTYLAELGFRRADGNLERLAISGRVDLPRAPALSVFAAGARKLPPRILPPLVDEARIEMAAIDEGEDIGDSDQTETTRAVPTAGPWPAASELSAWIPSRAESVDAWYEKTGSIGSAIDVAQRAIAAEVRDIAVPDDQAITGLAGNLDAIIAKGDPASMARNQETSDGGNQAHEIRTERAPGSDAIADEPIRLEDYLTSSSHNMGQAACDVEIHIEVCIHGRIPHGRRATLFGRAITVDRDGSFVLKHELQKPVHLLPYLAPSPPPAGN